VTSPQENTLKVLLVFVGDEGGVGNPFSPCSGSWFPDPIGRFCGEHFKHPCGFVLLGKPPVDHVEVAFAVLENHHPGIGGEFGDPALLGIGLAPEQVYFDEGVKADDLTALKGIDLRFLKHRWLVYDVKIRQNFLE